MIFARQTKGAGIAGEWWIQLEVPRREEDRADEHPVRGNPGCRGIGAKARAPAYVKIDSPDDSAGGKYNGDSAWELRRRAGTSLVSARRLSLAGTVQRLTIGGKN